MKIESTFSSDVDSLGISMLEITPDQDSPKAVVQLVHGICEYKERYIPFMEYLSEHGIASVIHDHRGHGKSVLKPEHLGYMYGGRGDALIRDIEKVNRLTREKYPDIPLILLGHSMGALAVLAFTARHDDQIDGLVVTGNVAKLNTRLIAAVTAQLHALLRSRKHPSRTLTALSFSGYAKKFPGGSPYAWLCSDPEVVRAYEEDPLCGFRFTNDGFVALLDLLKAAYNESGYVCLNKDLPVLFLSGEEDPCIIDPAHFAACMDLIRKAGYEEISGKMYPGMRHEILNETGKLEVYEDILDWMKRKVLLQAEEQPADPEAAEDDPKAGMAPDDETEGQTAPDIEAQEQGIPDVDAETTAAPDAETEEQAAPEIRTDEQAVPDAEAETTAASDIEVEDQMVFDNGSEAVEEGGVLYK